MKLKFEVVTEWDTEGGLDETQQPPEEMVGRAEKMKVPNLDLPNPRILET